MSDIPQPDYALWLDKVCSAIPGAVQASVLLRARAGSDLRIRAVWRPGPSSPKASSDRSPESDGRGGAGDIQARTSSSPLSRVEVMHPFTCVDGHGGFLALTALAIDDGQRDLAAEVCRVALAAGFGFLQPAVDAGCAAGEAAESTPVMEWALILNLTAAIADSPSEREASSRALQLLRSAFSADRAALIEAEGTALVSLSPADMTAQSAVTRWLELRNEARLAGDTVVAPPPGAGDARLRFQHDRHLAAHRLASVATVALRHDGATFAYAILERHTSAFNPLEIERLQACAAILGPWLWLSFQASRSPMARMHDGLRHLLGRSRSTTRWLIPSLLMAALASVVLVAMWSIEQTTTASARVEGTNQSDLVAPVDGFIKSVQVKPGDTVTVGDVLAEIDGKELGLEAERLAGNVAEETAAADEAFAVHDRASGVLHQARADETQAQLDLVRLRLSQVILRAPFSGILIAGDLRNRIGAAVKRGDTLLTVAIADRYRIVADVPERDIAEIRPGLAAKLLLATEPGKPLELVISHISPVAHEKDGLVSFEVEAEPARRGASLRPGLTGVARIEIGPHPLWRVAAGRLLDSLRLVFWRWGA